MHASHRCVFEAVEDHSKLLCYPSNLHVCTIRAESSSLDSHATKGEYALRSCREKSKVGRILKVAIHSECCIFSGLPQPVKDAILFNWNLDRLCVVERLMELDALEHAVSTTVCHLVELHSLFQTGESTLEVTE